MIGGLTVVVTLLWLAGPLRRVGYRRRPGCYEQQ